MYYTFQVIWKVGALEAIKNNLQLNKILTIHHLHPILWSVDPLLEGQVTQYNECLDWLRRKDIEVEPWNDWDWMYNTRMVDRINEYIDKTFQGESFQFRCRGWWNVFWISEPVYEELCFMFFSTFHFNEGATNLVN